MNRRTAAVVVVPPESVTEYLWATRHTGDAEAQWRNRIAQRHQTVMHASTE
jgi:hypothetical protein